MSFKTDACIAVSVVIWPLTKYFLFSGFKENLFPFLFSIMKSAFTDS